MRRLLGGLSTAAYSAMRIVLGFLYLSHGLRWLFGAFGGRPPAMMSLFWAAGVIETVCGALIALGLYTSLAAFIASGEMAVAYFMAHAPRGRWPIQNGGELSAALCFAFLYVATQGAGPLSVGRLFGSRTKR